MLLSEMFSIEACYLDYPDGVCREKWIFLPTTGKMLRNKAFLTVSNGL